MQEPSALRSWPLQAALVLSILTAAFSLYMRIEAMGHEISGDASACKISPDWDCDKVQSSEYGKLFGISLSLWGAAGHVVLALLLGAWFRRRESTFLWLATFVVVFNVGASAVTFYLAKFKIGAFCMFCTILQVLTIALAWLVLASLRGNLRGGIRFTALLAAGWMAVATFATTAAASAYVERKVEIERLAATETGRSVRLDVSDAIVLGNPTTRNSVLLYVDFGCPVCRECYRKSVLLARQFPRDVHFVFKHFPLDKVCNDKLIQTTNHESCRAAFAAAAANARGRGLQAMQSFFVDRTGGFTDFFFEDFARAQGFDVKEFDASRASPAAKQVVTRDVNEGNAMDFDRVPMVFLNGRRIEPAYLQQRVVRACRER